MDNLVSKTEDNFSKVPIITENTYFNQVISTFFNIKLHDDVRLIEIYGKSSSGKTYLTLKLLAELQNYAILYIDTEFSFNQSLCYFFKIPLDNIIVFKSNNFKDIMDTMEQFKNCINIVVIDSFSAINFPTFDEMHTYFMQFLYFSHFNNIPIIFTNQLRNNFISRKLKSFGSKDMKFYYDLRIETKGIKDNIANYQIIKHK